MLKRILAIAVAALVAPVPTVWLFVKYEDWLHTRFLDIGLPEKGAVFGAVVCTMIAAAVLIATLIVSLVENAKQIGCWIKTGRFRNA